MSELSKRIVDFIFRIASDRKGSHKSMTVLGALFFSGLVFSIIILSLVTDRFLGLPSWPERTDGFIPAAIFLFSGAGLWLWSVLTFFRARGTPVPFSPPPQLVVSGPYAYARNPMLTGVFLILFGTGFLLQSLSLIAVFTPLFILASYMEFKMIEEPELEKRLGAQYAEYRERVPIFIPRFPGQGGIGKMLTWKWVAFWKPSLGRRMTVSFTVFGLIVGYLAVTFVMISLSRDFVKETGEFFSRRFYTLLPVSEPDGILKLVDRKEEDVTAVAAFAKSFPSTTHNIFNYSIYYRTTAGVPWHQIFIDENHVFRSRNITDAGTIGNLEKGLKRRVQTSSSIFLGREDEMDIWIDITRKGDSNQYILSLRVQRKGILKLLHQNIRHALIFGILLLLSSHLLAHLFSLRLARPIEALSREAAAMSAGDFDRRFQTDSRDEIGVLATSLNSMAEQVRSALREREELLLGILTALIRTVDAKSKWTAGHSERVAGHAEAMGRFLHFDDVHLRDLTISAILHDIGKIGVPEHILDKPGRLTEAEFDIVKSHPRAGADIIADIPSYDTILPGVLYHHERWDGSGYPEGLRGDSIPLFARIIAVADVYDAITDNRPYRKAWGFAEANRFLAEQKGKMFDPDIVDAFLCLMSSGAEISHDAVSAFNGSHVDKR